jgi:nucleoside-diphosphate-sugar epimerase
MRIALTGATGFVGNAICAQLLQAGHVVQALTRRAQNEAGPNWIKGDLLEPESLHALVKDCDVLIHCGGVVKGSPQDFFKNNVEATGYVVLAAARAKVKRIIHISSLAARDPKLSDYANSKYQSESFVREANITSVILRPCAIYGPGDRETLQFFTAAKRGIVPVPNTDRAVSLIHVEDFARAVVACVTSSRIANMEYDIHDGMPGGYSFAKLVGMIGDAVGTPARPQPMPRWLVNAFAHGVQLFARITGRAAILNPGKVREMFDLDTVVRDDSFTRATGWTATIAAADGLRTTASWYRGQGWL